MAGVVAYRMTPRALGYAIAAVAAFAIISGAVGGLGSSRGVAGDFLFATLVVAGLLGALALVLWTTGSEVRVCDAGVMSIGLRVIEMIRWREIDRFEVGRYRSSPFTVYAVLTDGSRVALEALRGGSSHGDRVEQFRRHLDTKLADERSRQGSGEAIPAAWPPAPLGWRHRARSVGAVEQ
jgi:hypothetical protein